MTEDEGQKVRRIGAVLANLPGAGRRSEMIAQAASLELADLVRSWAPGGDPFPPVPESNTPTIPAADCALCGGSGVVSAVRTEYNQTTGRHHTVGVRTIPCPNGCNPEKVSRIIDNSKSLMDDASRAAGMTTRGDNDDTGPDGAA